MAMISATICLAIGAVLFIIAVAVIAFLLWQGMSLIYDKHAEATGSQHQVPMVNSINGYPQNAPCSWMPPGGARGDNPLMHLQGHSIGSLGVAMQNRMWCDEVFDLTSPICTQKSFPMSHPSIDSPTRRAPAANGESPEDIAVEIVSPRKSPDFGLEDLCKGYAATLSNRFKCETAFLVSNVSAVADTYALGMDDVCYCFLCLESVEGDELAIKPHGVNSFAARIWIVALARFVKAAQGQRWAHDNDRVQTLTEEWNYQLENFVQMVKSCEAPFARKYGNLLLQAFSQEEMRCENLGRARETLVKHAALAAPPPTRLVGAGAGANANAKALRAPPRAAALTDGPRSSRSEGGAWAGRADTSAHRIQNGRRPLRDIEAPGIGLDGPRKRGRHA